MSHLLSLNPLTCLACLQEFFLLQKWHSLWKSSKPSFLCKYSLISYALLLSHLASVIHVLLNLARLRNTILIWLTLIFQLNLLSCCFSFFLVNFWSSAAPQNNRICAHFDPGLGLDILGKLLFEYLIPSLPHTNTHKKEKKKKKKKPFSMFRSCLLCLLDIWKSFEVISLIWVFSIWESCFWWDFWLLLFWCCGICCCFFPWALWV